MKDYLRQLAEQPENPLFRQRLVVEYLQARILQSLQDQGAFLRWAFLGGTALRFLYAIPRFSEDLDFSLLNPGSDPGFKTALAEAKRALAAEGYRVEINANDRKTVVSALVKFPGLPHELGISPHAAQAWTVKVEVDTSPPAGAGIETTLVRRHVTLHLCHYDRPSLLAGKLHAILSRSWPKGRDLYDLAWYLADRTWPAPNLELLNAALAQTGWTGPLMTARNWRPEVRERLMSMDWEKARADVRPFLERERDLDLVALGVLNQLLT